VFGVKYRDGVVLAADTLGSYGSLARYNGLERVFRVNANTVVACSGDYADFQFLREIIEQRQREEDLRGGGVNMMPAALHCWITRYLYNKRSKFDPLWTTIIVGGIQDGEPFLGYVNLIGTAFTENAIATGIGMDIGLPLLRSVQRVLFLFPALLNCCIAERRSRRKITPS
jgi:20S proteasome subunit beta 7